MACLGLPVDSDVADAMGTIRLEANDTLRADHVSGNSMHFSSIGVIQLVALACFQKLP